MSRWLAVVSTFVLIASPAKAEAADWPSDESVGPKIDELLKEYDRPKGPGCAVGVYNAGKILFAKGYGQADLKTKRPVSPKSVFNIASLTKQFTAFAIALLESEGKLSLDAPVRQYVPELPDFGSPISIRHLIHHTSGLRDYGALMELTGWKLDQELSRKQLLGMLARQRALNFAPGSSHEYGNTNYVLLAMIIERVSGRPFGEFLAERVFRPLGMADSGYAERATATEDLARNYAPHEDGFFVNHVWARAYAPGVVSVYSSIADLARWDANFYRPVVGDPNLVDRLYSPGRLSSGERTNYAFGLYTGTHRGFRTIAHSGLGGGSFYLLRFPDQRLSVATLCNEYGVGPKAPDTYSLSFKLADLYLPPVEAVSPVSKQPVAPAVVLSRAELERFVGDYWVEDEGSPISLRFNAGTLAELYGGKFYPIIPIGPGRFRVEDYQATYSFTGPNDDILTYREGLGENMRRAQRRPPWSPTSRDLHTLAGRYCSGEVGVCWSFEREGSQLWLVRPGFPRKPLNPVFADTFQLVDSHWIGTRNMRITLAREERGGVVGLRVSRGRVRNVLFDRTP